MLEQLRDNTNITRRISLIGQFILNTNFRKVYFNIY